MSNGRPPKTVAEWVRYLHVARAIPQDSPDYPQAQEAVRFALQRIRTLGTVVSAQDQPPVGGPKAVRPDQAVGLGLMHGLSLGAGEPIAGLLAALMPGGQGFREGAQQYREGLENIGLQQPTATPAGDVAGMALQSLTPLSQAVRGGTLTGAAIPSMRANALARFFTGAGQTNIAPALALGGIAGFSAGGEDPGDFRARLTGAGVGAGLSALGAAALGGLGALRVPRWLPKVRREIRQVLPKNTPPPVVEEITDTAIRQQLARQGYDAPTQTRILETWRAGKTEVPSPPPPPQPPMTMRPGETITPLGPPPVGPKATRTGTPDPLDVATFQRRGVGGHSYTGTYPAGTATNVPGRAAPSPMGGPMTPAAMQMQQMQFLAQLPEAEFQAASALFPPELVQQLRVLRGQLGLGGTIPQ
jgi:hypothetical protein